MFENPVFIVRPFGAIAYQRKLRSQLKSSGGGTFFSGPLDGA